MESLSKTELNELLHGCKSGDEMAFSSLAEYYEPMLNGVISDFSMNRDETISEALMALHRAALTYNEEQNSVTFGLYAKICVSNRLTDIYRAENGRKGRVSDIDVDTIPVGSGIFDMLVRQEERESFRSKARAALSDYEYNVLMLWMDGESAMAIADRLSVKQKSVDNAKARIFKKLREAFGSCQ